MPFAALAFLGGWPLALLRAAWSALLEAVKTPLGAAVVTGLVLWPIAHHAGYAESEARHAAIAERARIEAAARTESDREIAREQDRGLAYMAAVNARLFEEIRHAPLPQPRPDGRCIVDAGDIVRIRPGHH